MTTFTQQCKTALFALALASTAANAADATHGQHGMALFGGKDGLYASHLPLFHTPHDYQVILKVHVADPATDAALRARLDGKTALSPTRPPSRLASPRSGSPPIGHWQTRYTCPPAPSPARSTLRPRT